GGTYAYANPIARMLTAPARSNPIDCSAAAWTEPPPTSFKNATLHVLNAWRRSVTVNDSASTMMNRGCLSRPTASASVPCSPLPPSHTTAAAPTNSPTAAIAGAPMTACHSQGTSARATSVAATPPSTYDSDRNVTGPVARSCGYHVAVTFIIDIHPHAPKNRF